MNTNRNNKKSEYDKKNIAEALTEYFNTTENFENAKMIHYSEIPKYFPTETFVFDEDFVPEDNTMPFHFRRMENGDLLVTMDNSDHALIIGSTGSGKTQMLLSILKILIKSKKKPSFLFTDPKGEGLHLMGNDLEANGYKIIVIDFSNPENSDYWNPLTEIFLLHQRALNYESQIKVVKIKGKAYNEFRGKIYESQIGLDNAVKEYIENLEAEKENKITDICNRIFANVTGHAKDSNWTSGGKDIKKGFLYGMLEDSEPNDRAYGLVTVDNYSYDTVFNILDSFGGKGEGYDNGYFSDRDPETSKAYHLASKYLLIPAEITRAGFVSELCSAVKDMRDASIRKITSANSFSFSDFEDGKDPIAIFISFKDETKIHYSVISLFVQQLYTALVEMMRKNNDKPRESPFYFFLDEFGNMPVIDDFPNMVSLGRGRNIWFWIVLQSYSQLYSSYGEKDADTIKNNLNTHIYLGTNDSRTKSDFSKECGEHTIISPSSIFRGEDYKKMEYSYETRPLIPISMIEQLSPGECFIKRLKDKEYTIMSKIERHHTCPEFNKNKQPYVFKSSFVRDPDKHKYDAITMAAKRKSKSFFDF